MATRRPDRSALIMLFACGIAVTVAGIAIWLTLTVARNADTRSEGNQTRITRDQRLILTDQQRIVALDRHVDLDRQQIHREQRLTRALKRQVHSLGATPVTVPGPTVTRTSPPRPTPARPAPQPTATVTVTKTAQPRPRPTVTTTCGLLCTLGGGH